MTQVLMRPHHHSGVYTDGGDLYTRSLLGDAPEAGRVVQAGNGFFYRPFPPPDTKLAAMVRRGCRSWPFSEDARVLYLGAGAGTTVAHVSDLCPGGTVYAVEFAPEPFRSLLSLARSRTNVVPILADARSPGAYAAQLGGPVDVLYQDVAQRDQWDIAHRNTVAHLTPGGWMVLMVKASSIDVARRSEEVFAEVRARAEASGFQVLEMVGLEPYQRDHCALVARAPGPGPGTGIITINR